MNALEYPTGVPENEVRWGTIEPTEHIVHFYADDPAFLDMLEGFVAGGLIAGESVIVLASVSHMFALNARLEARRIDVRKARRNDQYLDMNADSFLATFMVDGRPDPQKFNEAVTALIDRARASGRRVRAFGEMVAILWGKGNRDATVQLELLWNQLREKIPFPLYCAYPKAGFTEGTQESLKEICAAHTKVISNRA